MGAYAVRAFQPGDAGHFPEFTALGIDPLRVPYPAVTALHGTEPLGCAGLILDGLGAAEAWMILRQPVNGHGAWVAWTVRRFLSLWEREGNLRRVWATAAENRPEAMRFLAAMGFTQEGLMRAYRVDGGASWMYGRVRRNES